MNYMALKDANRRMNYEEIRSGARRLRSKPLFFWFDISGPCNLECTHCGYRVFGRTSQQEVSQGVYEVVTLELMPTAYTCNLGGTNWGEMTISKTFHKFILDCKRFEVGVNLTTNGTRMSREWIDDLADALDVIGFSMEGIEEEFEKIRGFKWRHFLANVEKICLARADRDRRFRIEWRFCAHADNIHQLPAMIRLAKSIGVDRIQVMNLVPYVPEQKFKNLFYHRGAANHYFAEARKVAAELNFDVNIPEEFDVGTFETKVVQIGGAVPKPTVQTHQISMSKCYYPWQTCSINELGNVKPCCVHWHSMGSLERSSFDTIWNGARYRKLRASVNTKPDSICFNCRMPRFDSEQNISASQLASGLRELVQGAMTITRKRIDFSECDGYRFNPNGDRGNIVGGEPDPEIPLQDDVAADSADLRQPNPVSLDNSRQPI